MKKDSTLGAVCAINGLAAVGYLIAAFVSYFIDPVLIITCIVGFIVSLLNCAAFDNLGKTYTTIESHKTLICNLVQRVSELEEQQKK